MRENELRAMFLENDFFRSFIGELPLVEDETPIGEKDIIEDFQTKGLAELFAGVVPEICRHTDIIKVIKDDKGKILRYYLLTFIPEEAHMENLNLALLHFNKKAVYYAWAMRQIVEAFYNAFLTVTHKENIDAIQMAPLSWKYVYMGKEPFQGSCQLKRHYAEDGDDMSMDVHLSNLLLLPNSETIQRVIALCNDQENGGDQA